MIACSKGAKARGGDERAPAGIGFRGALSLGLSRTDLVFANGRSFAAEKTSVVYVSDFALSDRFSIELAAGALVSGSLRRTDGEGGTRIRSLGPGWVGALSASWTVVKQDGWVPFVILSGTFAGNGARTREEPTSAVGSRGHFYGMDFRFGAAVGETFWNVMSPYLALRVFGGPAFDTDLGKTSVGSDRYHVQPALGAVVRLGGGVDLFAEGAPVLERSLTVGLGLRR